MSVALAASRVVLHVSVGLSVGLADAAFAPLVWLRKRR